MSSAARKNAWRLRLLEEQNWLCYWCGRRMNLQRYKNGQPTRRFATFEHLKRRREGGRESSTNIVLSHRICNFRREQPFHTSPVWERVARLDALSRARRVADDQVQRVPEVRQEGTPGGVEGGHDGDQGV